MGLIPIGLALDCIGAILLAVVEIPQTREQLESEELKSAKNTLWSPPYKLERGEHKGFGSILDLLDKKTSRLPEKETVNQISKTSLETGTESIYAGRPTAEGIEVTQAFVLEVWIDREIDRRIGKTYRLLGAFLLLGGFFLQILGYIYF